MPYGGPGPSPFGRDEACGDGGRSLTGNGGPDTNAMGSPRAETTATLTNTAVYFYVWDQVGCGLRRRPSIASGQECGN